MAGTGAPKLDSKELAASYGWAMNTLNAVPELKSLFAQAVKKQYKPERFKAELRNTKWFQTTAEPARKYLVLRTAEPADYVSKMKQTMAAFADQYSQMTGEVLPVNYPSLKTVKKKVGGKTVTSQVIVNGSGFLAHAADMSLKLGYNENQVRDALFGAVKWRDRVKDNSLRGQSSANLQALRQQAAAYGVQVTDDWMGYRVGELAKGEDTLEGAAGMLKKYAKQRYSHLAADIDAGRTVDDIADPYKQSMARVLELNPNDIDVFDKRIQEGLMGKEVPNVGRRAATINEFERSLRGDERWQFTQNAKDTIVGRTQSLLKSFGLAV